MSVISSLATFWKYYHFKVQVETLGCRAELTGTSPIIIAQKQPSYSAFLRVVLNMDIGPCLSTGK